MLPINGGRYHIWGDFFSEIFILHVDRADGDVELYLKSRNFFCIIGVRKAEGEKTEIKAGSWQPYGK